MKKELYTSAIGFLYSCLFAFAGSYCID